VRTPACSSSMRCVVLIPSPNQGPHIYSGLPNASHRVADTLVYVPVAVLLLLPSANLLNSRPRVRMSPSPILLSLSPLSPPRPLSPMPPQAWTRVRRSR
jgi:hypothetical protein